MKKTEKLTVRLPRVLLDRLTEVAQRRDLTISELIRENLSEHFQIEYLEHREKIIVRLPVDHLDKLKMLVQSGDVFTIEHAIQSAVRDYIARRPKEIIQQSEVLKKIYEHRGLVESAKEGTRQKLKK